jgi:hypothetical protein
MLRFGELLRMFVGILANYVVELSCCAEPTEASIDFITLVESAKLKDV